MSTLKTRPLPSIRERCDALLSVSTLSAWERSRLVTWRELDWATDKQREILTGIERRVFGKGACD